MLNTKAEKLPVLDGLRGYAALWVLLGHICIYTGLKIPFLMVPGYAVDVFMIMSGFLMAQQFLIRKTREPWDSPRTHLAFYVRRFFRIAPLYYVVLLPAVLGHSYYANATTRVAHFSSAATHDPSEHALTLFNLLMHISFLFGLSPKYCSNLAIPDWSIGLEMQFYALFPLCMILAKRYGLVAVSAGSYAIWFLSNHFFSIYVTSMPKGLGLFPQPSFLPLKLVYFTGGILLAWAYIEDRRLTKRSAAIILLATIQVSVTGNNASLFVFVILTFLLFKDLEVPASVRTSLNILDRLLSNQLAVFLGDTSYGVYLVHMLLLIPALTLIQSGPPAFRFCLLAASIVPLSYATYWILMRLVEKPGIALGKHFSSWISRPSRSSVIYTAQFSSSKTSLGSCEV